MNFLCTSFIVLVTTIKVLPVTSFRLADDVQLIDGYDLENNHHGYNSEYMNYEPDDDGLDKELLPRNKRNYEVIESHGLKSHFHATKRDQYPTFYEQNPHVIRIPRESSSFQNFGEYVQTPRYTGLHPPPPPPSSTQEQLPSEYRFKRNVEDDMKSIATEEPLPVAEKQYAEPNLNNYDKRSRSLPYSTDYSKIMIEEEDSQSQAAINEGIKARAPRVNFVTQKKNIETAEARERPAITKPNEYYRDLYDAYPPPKYYDDYMGPLSRRYDLYPRKYDRWDRELNGYHPHYDSYDTRKRYDDDYVPRTPNSFYVYPNEAYDLPEPRDYPQIPYTNEIERMLPPPPLPYQSSYYNTPRTNRRIIYYATLPEVIRTPPNVDLRYRSSSYTNNASSNNNIKYNNNYQAERYRSNRSPRYYNQPQQVTSSSTVTSSIRDVTDHNHKEIKSTPVRVTNTMKVKDQPTQTGSPRTPAEHRHFNDAPPVGSGSQLNTNNKNQNKNMNNNNPRTSMDSRSSYQDSVDDRDQTYFSRNH